MAKKGGPQQRLLLIEMFIFNETYIHPQSPTNTHVSPPHTRIGGKDQKGPHPRIYRLSLRTVIPFSEILKRAWLSQP